MESNFGGESISEMEMDASPRPLFIEMAQLSARHGAPTQWREVARLVDIT